MRLRAWTVPPHRERSMARILVIEDDPQTATEIVAALNDYGAEAESVGSGREGLLKAAGEKYDCIVLDRMLPGGLNGLGVLSTLRSVGVETPVLILSALSNVEQRVQGLREGGDDYLVKPFDPLELTARLEVLMRPRPRKPAETKLVVGALEMSLLTHEVHCGGREIALLPREYRVLEYLMRHAGQIVTRSMLFEEVWGFRLHEQTNAIDVHIGKLRRKLAGVPSAPTIKTERGAGYVLNEAG